MAAKCKVVTVCGQRRKLCWTAKGKIKSNTPVGGAKRKAAKKGKRKATKRAGSGFQPVAKATALNKRTGRLKKGCKIAKGGKYFCKK